MGPKAFKNRNTYQLKKSQGKKHIFLVMSLFALPSSHTFVKKTWVILTEEFLFYDGAKGFLKSDYISAKE